jgi:hypothetical protein
VEGEIGFVFRSNCPRQSFLQARNNTQIRSIYSLKKNRQPRAPKRGDSLPRGDPARVAALSPGDRGLGRSWSTGSDRYRWLLPSGPAHLQLGSISGRALHRVNHRISPRAWGARGNRPPRFDLQICSVQDRQIRSLAISATLQTRSLQFFFFLPSCQIRSVQFAPRLGTHVCPGASSASLAWPLPPAGRPN